MAARKAYAGYIGGVRKKTRAGAGKRSKGTKKYKGQGGHRKRVRQNCKPGRQEPKR